MLSFDLLANYNMNRRADDDDVQVIFSNTLAAQAGEDTAVVTPVAAI